MGSGGSLLSFIGRRLLITIPLLILISFGVFSLVLIIPGRPGADAGRRHALQPRPRSRGSPGSST